MLPGDAQPPQKQLLQGRSCASKDVSLQHLQSPLALDTPSSMLAALPWAALSCSQELVVPGKSSADLLAERNTSLGQKETWVCQGNPEAGVWGKGMSYFINVVLWLWWWAPGKIWVSALYRFLHPSCLKKAEPSPNSMTAPKKFKAICSEAAL